MFRHCNNFFLTAATILALGTASIAPAKALTFNFTPTPFEGFLPGENLQNLKIMLGVDDYSMSEQNLLTILRNQPSWLGSGGVYVDDTVDSIPLTNPPPYLGSSIRGTITTAYYYTQNGGSLLFVSRSSRSTSYGGPYSTVWHFTRLTPFVSLEFACNANLIINCSGSPGWNFHRSLSGRLIYYGPIVVTNFSSGLPPTNPTPTPTPTETPTSVSSTPEPSSVFGLLLLGGAWLLLSKVKQILLTSQGQIG